MIPIYRAKKLNSDEYVIGYLLDNMIITAYEQIVERDDIYWKSIASHKIDTATLSIHFPDMLDSQGNKIFASLSKDGKGGDKFLFDNETFIIWFDNQSLKINATNKDNFECNCHDSLNEWYDFNNKCYDLKVIGIQE